MSPEAARRAAVLGSPIQHSLSPVLHQAAYDALGLDWRYDAVEVTEDALAGFLDELDGTWAGLSLTMPLKRAVLPLLDERSELVDAVGAANTVLLAGGRRRGENTDVHGVTAALAEAGCADAAGVRHATVLGAGATAASAVAALAGLGCTAVTVIARSATRAGAVLDAAPALGVTVGVEPWPGEPEAWAADVLVSTVPAGAADAVAADLPGTPGVLLDVVYAPWPSRLATAAAEHGAVVVGGLAMLVHQAARQVELMTGSAAPVEAMRAALRAAVPGCAA